jgi:hypothetical protein
MKAGLRGMTYSFSDADARGDLTMEWQMALAP